jgi:hypothetical protein
MNDTPPEFPTNGHFKALYDRLNVLIRSVRRRTIIPGPGISIEQKELGTVVKLRVEAAPSSGDESTHTWG